MNAGQGHHPLRLLAHQLMTVDVAWLVLFLDVVVAIVALVALVVVVPVVVVPVVVVPVAVAVVEVVVVVVKQKQYYGKKYKSWNTYERLRSML